MATKGQKFKTFTNEERTEIVSKYMSGKYSYAILSKEYIFYHGSWYPFSKTNDIILPVEAIVDYDCEILRGKYET